MKRTAFLLILGSLLLGTIACSITVDLTPTPLPPTQAAVETAVPTSVPMQTITVYFTNEARFAVGTEPYEDPVTRQVPQPWTPCALYWTSSSSARPRRNTMPGCGW